MPYVDLAGLSRFAGKSKDFASSACAGLDMANWQRTAAAGAVSFLPVPEMPLDPVVNFLFTETGPASGTKGPDNPSTITGVNSVMVARCGKNIIRAHATGSHEISGVTFTVGEDGSVTANGTASENAVFYYAPSGARVQLKAGCQYALSGCPAGGSNSTYHIRDSALQISDFGNGATATAGVDVLASVRIVVMSGTTVSNLVFKPQLELGSAATAFEPYAGTDYTIPLGGTYYGGSVDLSTGVMTVTYVGYILNGAEEWWVYTEYEQYNKFALNVQYRKKGIATADIWCTHFTPGYSENNFYFNAESVANNRLFIYMNKTLEQFKEFLSTQYSNGTPVVCVEKIADSDIFTVPLTPTQIYSLSQLDPYVPRTNTVYSDQVSVQVGYPKSPQATQNELTSAIVSLGGNV